MMNTFSSDQGGAKAQWLEGAHGPGPRLMTSSTLTGDTVVNRDNETLGTISDIMLDVLRGRVAYAVMASGGFMGVGERLFALPWAALELDPQRHCFVLDVDRATLDKAPGFDRAHWPSEADLQWQQNVHRYYGTRPYWE
jgi:hypothetical protein